MSSLARDTRAATACIHRAYAKVLESRLPPGIAFELSVNISLGCVRLRDMPLACFEQSEYVRAVLGGGGDGGIDGISIYPNDKSSVCQAKDRPNSPIEAGDARDFCYVVRRLRDDPDFANADFFYCVSTRTHVRSGAKAIFAHERVSLRFEAAPSVPEAASVFATAAEVDACIFEEMEVDGAADGAADGTVDCVNGAAASGAVSAPVRSIHVVDEGSFTPSQRAALEAGRAFLASSSREWALQAPGGWGKSSVMRALVQGGLSGLSVLALAPSTHLEAQLQDALEGLADVTTYQALSAMAKRGEKLQSYDVIICDEAHHLDNSNTWRASVTRLVGGTGEAGEVEAAAASGDDEDGEDDEDGDEDEDEDDDNEDEDGEDGEDGASSDASSVDLSPVLSTLSGASKVLYFSALFMRRQPDFEVSYETAVTEGRIVDYVVHAVQLQCPAEETRPLEVSAWLRQQMDTLDIFLGELTLVFWSKSERAIAASAECERLGIASAALTRASPPEVQRRFDGKKLIPELERIQVVHLCGMLNEGVDIPFASTVVFGDDRASIKNGFQCMLRASRTSDAKLSFFNVVAFSSAGDHSIAIGAITFLATTDARLKACFEGEEGGAGGEGAEAGLARLRRSGRVRVHVQPPRPGSDAALAFDAEEEAAKGFRTLWSATRAQMAGGAFFDAKKLAQYTARANWIAAQTEPVMQQHPRVDISFTFLGQSYTDSFQPGRFLNQARDIANGRKTQSKIPPPVIEILQQWRFFDSGIASRGSMVQSILAFVEKNNALPKKHNDGSEEDKLAISMNNCMFRDALPNEWVGCVLLENKFAVRKAAEPRVAKTARLLNELAALSSRPNRADPLYILWQCIRHGHTAAPPEHALRSVEWTGGEAAWEAIDAVNVAYKAAQKEKRAAAKKRRLEAAATGASSSSAPP
jgi:superfamily II DNA or RNA helicase